MIYFIQCGAGGPIKIGVSDTPRQRMIDLQCASPFDMTMLKIAAGSFCEEGDLHDRFSEEHLRGEWFHPSVALLAYIQTLPSIITEDIAKIATKAKRREPIPRLAIDQLRKWRRINKFSRARAAAVLGVPLKKYEAWEAEPKVADALPTRQKIRIERALYRKAQLKPPEYVCTVCGYGTDNGHMFTLHFRRKHKDLNASAHIDEVLAIDIKPVINTDARRPPLEKHPCLKQSA